MPIYELELYNWTVSQVKSKRERIKNNSLTASRAFLCPYI